MNEPREVFLEQSLKATKRNHNKKSFINNRGIPERIQDKFPEKIYEEISEKNREETARGILGRILRRIPVCFLGGNTRGNLEVIHETIPKRVSEEFPEAIPEGNPLERAKGITGENPGRILEQFLCNVR